MVGLLHAGRRSGAGSADRRDRMCRKRLRVDSAPSVKGGELSTWSWSGLSYAEGRHVAPARRCRALSTPPAHELGSPAVVMPFVSLARAGSQDWACEEPVNRSAEAGWPTCLLLPAREAPKRAWHPRDSSAVLAVYHNREQHPGAASVTMSGAGADPAVQGGSGVAAGTISETVGPKRRSERKR